MRALLTQAVSNALLSRMRVIAGQQTVQLPLQSGHMSAVTLGGEPAAEPMQLPGRLQEGTDIFEKRAVGSLTLRLGPASSRQAGRTFR